MDKYAISPAAPLFATLTVTNDKGDNVKVNPRQLQICGSSHLNQLLHEVKDKENARVRVKYDDLQALRDAVHYGDLCTASSTLETMLSVLQSSIYFNFTNLDASHTIRSVLWNLSKVIHASLLYHVICCKTPFGLEARNFCLKYALPVCKHNFYQMPPDHMTTEVLTMIADQDDLCLTSESQLADAISVCRMHTFVEGISGWIQIDSQFLLCHLELDFLVSVRNRDHSIQWSACGSRLARLLFCTAHFPDRWLPSEGSSGMHMCLFKTR